MIINMSSSGSPGKVVTVHVTPETQASVTCTNNNKTFTSTTDATGNAIFKLTKGIWSITVEKNGFTKTVNINVTEDCAVELSLEQLPKFTYTGNYKIVDDSNTPINSSLGNWKIRFLTSGTLTFTTLNGAENGIDVFCVGGGGGGAGQHGQKSACGGGGGYTKTQKSVNPSVGEAYSIVIGGGGSGGGSWAGGGAGGTSSAFSVTADGGKGAYYSGAGYGGAGGSGGGGSYWTSSSFTYGPGGSDGSDGGGGRGGAGQGTTTREFGDADGTLYAGGGGAYPNSASGGSGGGGNGNASGTGGSGATNTGGGGGGGGRSATGDGTNPTNYHSGGKGGSGIVVIRNSREEQ